MTKGTELTDFERGFIIGASSFGVTEDEIGEKLGRSRNTVHTVIAKYKENRATTVAKRSGRPCILTERDERQLKRIVKSDCKQPLSVIRENLAESSGTVVSKSTIRRKLCDMGYNSRIAVHKPLLSNKNIKDRLAWAKKKGDWSLEDWKKVVWSDESRFTLFQNDGRIRVWRLPNERYKVDCVVPTVKHGGGGVMVWACFTWNELGPLIRLEGKINSQRYIEEVLQNATIPFIKSLRPKKAVYIFQHDNAPIHTSHMTRQFLEQSEIRVLDWPGQSPDLNPIEHLWDELGRRVHRRMPPPKNERELMNFLQTEWNLIPREYYRNLIKSMNNRIEAVNAANGNVTPY